MILTDIAQPSVPMTCKRALDAIFPWGSDSESAEEDFEHPSQEPVAQRLAKRQSRPELASGIMFNLVPHGSQAGKVILHCQNAIQKLRMDNGGESLAIYKIGITHDYSDRFELYEANGWTTMLIMIESSDLGFIEMLEAALISHHRGRQQCRNIVLGGEGMRDRNGNPKFAPPYYCYCTAARADLPKWVV